MVGYSQPNGVVFLGQDTSSKIILPSSSFMFINSTYHMHGSHVFMSNWVSIMHWQCVIASNVMNI